MAPSRTQTKDKSLLRQSALEKGAGWRREALAYLLTGLLCCAGLVWTYQLWRADIGIPLQYGSGGDITLEGILAKDIVDHGGILHDPELGAPGEQDLRDFPLPDAVTTLSMKAMSWFIKSWGLIMNLYFFGGFLLTAWIGFAVLRHFGMARAPAMVAALLFDFLPYHFYRGEWHLHLSAYFVIPLGVLVMLWLMSGERLFQMARRGRFLRWPVPSKKGGAALLICLLLGSDGAYYCFFSILLLLAAGLYRFFEERSFRRLGAALLLAGIVGTAAVLNLLPNILHILAAGKDPEVVVRTPISAELYALKFMQLVLPIPGHRFPPLAVFRAAYDRAQPGILTEAQAAALGAFGAAAFCFLLFSLVAGSPWERHRDLIRRLSRLNICAFLLGTLGGVGSLVAWTLWSQIRAYNRISIFIGFFSAMALAAVLDEIWRRWPRTAIYRVAWGGVMAAILMAGVFDQTSRNWIPAYEQHRSEYANDADFCVRAEKWLPRSAMVLELPIVSFPETEMPGKMLSYDEFLPYLHSASLRWSYGAMKGRYWGLWQSHLAKLPFDEMLATAAATGFRAIYIDRNGYADRGAEIGARLDGLGLKHIEGRGGRFWLYDIQPYTRGLEAGVTHGAWTREHESALHPVIFSWLPGCSGREGDEKLNWHWCGSRGGFQLENPSVQTRQVEVHGAVLAGAGVACSLRVDGPGWVETIPLNAAPRPVGHGLTIPPGISAVHMHSDCPQLEVATDARPLVFRIDNFKAAFTDSTPAPALEWGDGFYPLEKDAVRTWHWCSSTGVITMRNSGPASETTVHMLVVSSQSQPAPLSISGPGFAESLTIGPARTEFSKRFVVPQGNSVIRFASSSPPLTPPHDPRKLVFRVEDFWMGNPLPEPTVVGN